MTPSQRLIQLTQKLIQMNTVNPPGQEAKAATFIAQSMRSLGLAVKMVAYAKNRPNVIVTLRGRYSSKSRKPTSLLLTPHIDTVPFGQGWKYDPLGGRIVNGRLYGRGATDDKGNLACCLEVMRRLVEQRIELKHDLVMAATADEETGSHHGLIPLLRNRVLRPGAAVILDADECDAYIVQKGLIHCRVQIHGKKAHGAYTWQGVNAIEQAARIIARLKKHIFRYKVHPLLRGPTLNIGVIRGGDKVNMVADFCEFALDVRFMPGMDSRRTLKSVRSIIEKETHQYKIQIDSSQPPYEIQKDHPLIKCYRKTARQMGVPVRLKGSNGATVMTFFKRYGIPAFATGYGTQGTAHITDEYVRIRTLCRGAQLLEQFVLNYDSRTR